MAKLIKNPLVSLEEIFLNQSVAPMISEPELVVSPIDESALESLHKEAFESGYLQGKTEERALIEQELSHLKTRLEELLSSIPNAIAQNRLDLSSEIADIVLLIAQQFFIESQKDKHALTQQINQILSQLNNKQTVELCLHPQEIAALQQGAIQLNATHLSGLKIKSDESLVLGGCLIKTNHGMFDASIEKQIDKLKEVLLQLKQRGQYASVD